MKKRWLYLLLFGLPGFLVAGITAFAVFGGAAGFAWLFVFGDDPWPASIHTVLVILFAAVFVIVWTVSLLLGFVTGKRLEKTGTPVKNHVLASAGICLFMLFLIAVHQYSVGNIGPVSDGRLCSRYCQDRGYAASGMPPADTDSRICYCFDDRGREAVAIPLDSIGTSP